jgi:hypothetical protein
VVTAQTAAGRIGRLVSGVVDRISCRSIILRQEDLAVLRLYVRLVSLLQLLRMALPRRKKKPVVPAGIRGTTFGGGARYPNDHLVSSGQA